MTNFECSLRASRFFVIFTFLGREEKIKTGSN